jgi:hypothetical protein
MEFGEAQSQYLVRGIIRKFILHFLYLFYFYELWNLKQISGIYIKKGNQENGKHCTVLGHGPAQDCSLAVQRPASRGG